ncbi:MAG: cell division protein FtsA [Oligoflexia bacterium]|nr:cell division protein FtsA [Bdellovibrionales bacterium]MYE07257.1 cell division protein FtsA [Oligoflexia bacterium]
MGRFNIEDKKVVAGIDLGATNVRCLIGTLSVNELTLAGSSSIPHKGLYKGRIVNMKETSSALQKAIEEAEVIAGLQVSQLFLGMSGDHHVFSSQGMSIISSQQVTGDDLNKAVETAKAVSLPTGHRLLHVLPKSFTVDREGPFFNPLGLSGLRLETSVMIISIPETNVQNALQCLRYAGCSARGLILQPLATSLAVLTENEKKSGTCVLDIGQDQTSLTVFINARVHHISSLCIGGEDFTHDLMSELKIPRDLAEKIKMEYGDISPRAEWENKETIEDLQKWDINTDEKSINTILSTRAELLFEEAKQTLKSLSYFDKLEEGFILTGGGSALKGIVETARYFMGKPVKKATIKRFHGMSELENKNNFATALGVLCYVQNENTLDYRSNYSNGKAMKIKRYLQDLFI